MIDSRQVKVILGATLVSLLLAHPPDTKAQEPEREQEQAYIAIIIDDMGYNLDRGRKAIAIPASLTYAVLPNSTHSTLIARMAHEAGKEVMVHMPMENVASVPMGKNVLTRSQRKEEFQVILDSIPFAQGVNNHMGSALTQESEAMQWFMESIGNRDMYFVDSRTTAKTIAFTVARSNNLRAASRDVFLDNEPTIYAIDKSFHRLMRIAKRRGSAIAIGHPYPATLQYLNMAIPKMEGIKIVTISDLIMQRQIGEAQPSYQTLASD